MPVGTAYKKHVPGSVAGPDHGSLFPDVLYVAALNNAGVVLYTHTVAVNSSVFSTILTGGATEGVSNGTAIEMGVPGAGVVVYGAGFYDAASGGNLVISGTFAAPVTGDGVQLLTLSPGNAVLKFV
jgi:hypothetical protein